MQSNEVVAQAVALLAPVAAGGVNIAQGVAVRILGDTVAERLQRDGHARVWEEFQHDFRNDSLIRHLLQQAVDEDLAFRVSFSRAVEAAARETPGNYGQQAITITGSGDAQIGDRGDTINKGRVATRGGTYHEGDVHRAGDRITNKKSSKAAIVTLMAVGVVVVALVVAAVKSLSGGAGTSPSQDASLTAGSTCQQFLNTDEQTEQQALVDIAVSKGIGGFGSPLALPEIRYECSSQPAMTMGAIVQRDKGEF
jgi:hypothetical protein